MVTKDNQSLFENKKFGIYLTFNKTLKTNTIFNNILHFC
jgi:hypothetical protein